jgi:hypothetical protein
MPVRTLQSIVSGVALVGLLSVSVGTASAQTAASAPASAPISHSVTFVADDLNPFAAGARDLAPRLTARPAVSFAAQTVDDDDDQGIAIGVLGMLTRTSWRGDEGEGLFDLDNRTGYGVGLWVGGNRNGRVGFVGEFIYLVRGDDDYRTTAVQIPAVFHVNIGSRSRSSVAGYVVVGPSFTINLKQEIAGVDVSEAFNGADIGVIGGAGVEFFRIGIEGRGNWGLRNISSDGDVSETKAFTFELLGKFAFN